MFDLNSLGGFGNAALIATAGTYILGRCQGIIRNVYGFLYTRYVGVFESNTLQEGEIYGMVSQYCSELVKDHSILKTYSSRLVKNWKRHYMSGDSIKATAQESDAECMLSNVMGVGTYFVYKKEYGFLKIIISKESGNGYNESTFGEQSTITIHFLTKRKSINKFISDISTVFKESVKLDPSVILPITPTDRFELIPNTNYWWKYSNKGRSISSIFLDEIQKNRIINDVDNFFKNEELYKKTDVPHRRGMMLYGKPGTGKTSIVKAIHQHLGINILTINLNSLDDGKLHEIFSNDILYSHKFIILFEDIDGVPALLKGNNAHRLGNDNEVSNVNEKSITLSGFLNAIDGVSSPEHVYFIFTSNAPNSLDDAVCRKGRIDVHEEIGYLDRSLQFDMIKYLTGKEIDKSKLPEFTKASEIQAICFEHLLHKSDIDLSKLPEMGK